MADRRNKVKFNLHNVHYAVCTVDAEGRATYGTPVPMPGAVSLSLDPEGEPSKFYADGYAYYIISNNMGYEGDLELAMIPESFRTDVLRESLDGNRVLVENADVETANFALLFEFDGDVRHIRHVLYYCSAARPNIESQTKEDEIEVKTETVSITASPLGNGLVKAKTGDDTDEATYRDWYRAVYLPVTGADVGLSALTVGSLALTPAFSPDVTEYAAETSNATNTVTATPRDADAEVTLTVNGAAVGNGSAVTWDDGENTVTAAVTNGGDARTYTVTVTKGV